MYYTPGISLLQILRGDLLFSHPPAVSLSSLKINTQLVVQTIKYAIISLNCTIKRKEAAMLKRIILCFLFVIFFSPLASGEKPAEVRKKDIVKEAAREIDQAVDEEAVKAVSADIVEEVKQAHVQRDVQVTRPLRDQGPTQVRVSVYVVDIDDVDTASQKFDANVYYEFTWNDPRLAGQYDEKVRKPLGAVWHPQMQFINQQRLWETYPRQVEIYPDGRVVYKQRSWGSFSQPLKLKDFPFDKQSFNILLTASRYTDQEVRFQNNEDLPCGIAEEVSVADWRIIGLEAGPVPSPLALDKKVFSLSIKAARVSGYYIIQIIVPLLFIIMMSWIVFWIDPTETGTQLSIGTTAMLTLIAFRFMTGITLPKIEYLTRLDYFILVATILVFLALIEVVITSWFARSGRIGTARKIDLVARVAFPLVFVLAALETLLFRVLM
ncbi:MAG: hypothetical protein GF409_01460 [Candidatus Omnitrophica bacterium]|nr:hypothetical protein [Candidatus Omnitrophota bacterium]